MKTIAVILFTVLISCNKPITLQERAENSADSTLKAKLNDPSTYHRINMSPIDTNEQEGGYDMFIKYRSETGFKSVLIEFYPDMRVREIHDADGVY